LKNRTANNNQIGQFFRLVQITAESFVANRVSRGIAGFGAQVAANPLTNRKKHFAAKECKRPTG
jgi:hypothetical protein